MQKANSQARVHTAQIPGMRSAAIGAFVEGIIPTLTPCDNGAVSFFIPAEKKKEQNCYKAPLSLLLYHDDA